MFSQYMYELKKSIQAKQSQSCGSGYQGSWRCVGPLSMPSQTLGKVDAIWADPADSNYILAGTLGGLFRSIDGGAHWECITDNAILANGIVGISSIAVNPLNRNTIYLGTSGEFYFESTFFQFLDYGAVTGLLFSKHMMERTAGAHDEGGGATW